MRDERDQPLGIALASQVAGAVDLMAAGVPQRRCVARSCHHAATTSSGRSSTGVTAGVSPSGTRRHRLRVRPAAPQGSSSSRASSSAAFTDGIPCSTVRVYAAAHLLITTRSPPS